MPDTDSFQVADTDPQNGPNSQLEIYDRVVGSNVDDEFLERENFGLGNYRDSEMWQQIQSFERGIFATEAFVRLLRERAIHETKRTLGSEGWTMKDPTSGNTIKYQGWDDLEDDELEAACEELGVPVGRSDFVDAKGQQIWEALIQKRTDDRYPAREALQEIAGIDGDWTPPHYRMLMMRHEVSRSRGARLMDNFFGRVKRQITDADNDGNGRLNRRQRGQR